MNVRQIATLSIALFLSAAIHISYAQQPPGQAQILSFYPQGTVKKIRQVQVRFSEPMVPIGDPRVAASPFEINCPEKGTERWVDSDNWAYDFQRDLPSGVKCDFRLRKDVRSMKGSPVGGQQQFSFSTGGPSIINSSPYEGSAYISDDQIFILQLDGPVVESSVLRNVSFSVEGISEKVGIRIVTEDEREKILEVAYPTRYGGKRPDNLLLVQATRTFPAKSAVNLIWGTGVLSPGGIATEQDQVLPFKTEGPFQATFSCQRENAEADCVPVSSMRLSFSNSVPWKSAKKITLTGPSGKIWKAESWETIPDDENTTVDVVLFRAPFPESSAFRIELPPDLKDDAGRALTNAGEFPLSVKTDEYPPLAKFAAEFGILELKADPVLPVTLRNIEPELSGNTLQLKVTEDSNPITADLNGKVLRIGPDRIGEIFDWIGRVVRRGDEDRHTSVFAGSNSARSFKLPKPEGSRPFEVVGIPLRSPGFYVVELESDILGASLLGKPARMYVPATALVTNLAVHFKWGAESSIIWVTALDSAKPVKQATLEVRDCTGTLVWKGVSDANGIGRIPSLPKNDSLPRCSNSYMGYGLIATARLADDMAFVHSNWNEGIESWRYRLPTEWNFQPTAAHTILDRSLFRAGETVHMKHVLRRTTTAGFAPYPAAQLPGTLVIQHLGSDQEYEFPLKWDASGIAENTWSIPKEAKLGRYSIYFRKAEKGSGDYNRYDYRNRIDSGSFRVEEYRVPLMRAVIRPPSEALVRPPAVPVDLTVSYLSGGGAGNLPVKFRHDIRPYYDSNLAGYEGFVFSNGSVKEGLIRMDVQEEEEVRSALKSTDLALDRFGSARTIIESIPEFKTPIRILAELEFRDPNGEVQTVSSTIPLWPSAWIIGIQPDSWLQSKDSLRYRIMVLDLNRKPVANAPVTVDLFEARNYSHRKRLTGGFYAYEHFRETRRIGEFCTGKTDRRGMLNCEKPVTASGQLIVQASTADENERPAITHVSTWVAGEEEWWFEARDDDRIDVIPEKKQYEPGEKARFQVRMPFRKATALVTVEREGVGDAFIKVISGKNPVIEVPVKGNYAPNAYISVMAVRGRASGTKPTAMVDLGKPAYKLGIAEIKAGWKAHELKVAVTADREQYKVREKATVRIAVTTPDGNPPPAGSEVAIAAVDEGLLELMPNRSWDVLEAMMGRRSYGVLTATAQMYVIGKRHFGLKALPQGGGGGSQATRELFDTLLLWRGRVPLDTSGRATIEVPLNDSITSFRIVAVATSGMNLFGSGSTSIRSSQDLILLSGIAPVIRAGDRFRSTFTLRNTTERALQVRVAPTVAGIAQELETHTLSLESGESKSIFWDLTAPAKAESLVYRIEATAGDGIRDSLSVTQRVVPAVPVRTLQATMTQISGEQKFAVERPNDSVPGAGGINVSFAPTLLEGMSGVTDYMKLYPYTCLEQRISRAVALRDSALWRTIAAEMPAYLDSDGLLKYFPSTSQGSDVLTSYILSIAHEANIEIPAETKKRMTEALQGFVQGRIVRYSSLPTVDLTLRKLSAIAALSRGTNLNPDLLSSIKIDPNLWPTSAVIDWLQILQRVSAIDKRQARMAEAEQILRSRLNLQGTALTFSTENRDHLWWLMTSPDENSVRLLLSVLESPGWKGDIGRLARGALGRHKRGHWDTTVANAWGVLAMEKFSKIFEGTPVTGTSSATMMNTGRTLNWAESPKGKEFSFQWPEQRSDLSVRMAGTGRPWVTVRSMAAIPLKEPLSTGFRIKKTVTPLEQKERNVWSRGDLMRVRVEIEAQSDMTWVVLNDPIPAGSTILGSGLGRDSSLSVRGEKWDWRNRPAFEERSFEAFRAYYEFVPKGSWSVEYTVRLNNEGTMSLPPTRVEALYMPEMFGEAPNQPIQIR